MKAYNARYAAAMPESVRLAKQARRIALKTPEQRAADNVRSTAYRVHKMTAAQFERKREVGRNYMRKRRELETPEQREAKRAYMKAYGRKRFLALPVAKQKALIAKLKAFAALIPEDVKSQYRKDYKAAHRDNFLVYTQNRLKRIRASGQKLSVGIIKKLLALQKGKCAACRESITTGKRHLDHIVPVSRGGEHADKNMQLLCQTCNLNKSSKPPEVFMRERGYLL